MAYLDVHDACRVVLLTPGSESSGGLVLNQTDYTRDSYGNTVALDGSQGQVMLRVPAFHYSYGFSGSTHSWRVSLNPFSGSVIHPWFAKSGIAVPYRYIGVYEAAGYDVSAAAYVDGDGSNSWFDTSADKLGSIVGKKPLSSKTRAQFRAAAARVGTGWSLMDFWGYAALKLLYITKHADFESQLALGQGNTRWPSWDFATRIGSTGKVLSVQAPGQSTAGGSSGDYCNFLGIENPYGDIWEFVDGWNINNGVNYICTDPASFADDVGPTSAYALYGSTNPTSSGWQDTLQQNVALLPAGVGASDTTKVTDYYWYASGWRVPLIGGGANYGSDAGLWALYTYNGSSFAHSYFGGRLCF